MKEILKITLYKPLFNLLIFLVWLIPGHSLGLAIIVLTILVRFALYPFSLSATRAQKRMKDLQPEIGALKEKYKDDQKAQAQATMALYKERGINPLGSCFPLLIQFPILIILFYVFRDVNRFDLLYPFTPRPGFINNNFLGIDLTKPELWVLPIITGITQFISSKQMQLTSGGGGGSKGMDFQKMMTTQMIYIFPLMTVLIARSLPAALSLYWTVTTIFGIIQQWLVFKGSSKLKTQSAKPEEEKPSQEIAEKKKSGVEVVVRRKG